MPPTNCRESNLVCSSPLPQLSEKGRVQELLVRVPKDVTRHDEAFSLTWLFIDRHLTGCSRVCANRYRRGLLLLIVAINLLGSAENESEVWLRRKESEEREGACWRVTGALASFSYSVLQHVLVSEWRPVQSATPCLTSAVELQRWTTSADRELKYRLPLKHLMHVKFKLNVTEFIRICLEFKKWNIMARGVKMSTELTWLPWPIEYLWKVQWRRPTLNLQFLWTEGEHSQ